MPDFTRPYALGLQEPDPVLQALVLEAGRIAEAPIALVSLVLERIQFFEAHVGLPDALTVSRATSHCDSFCQFVVEEEQPLYIEDALADYSLPQNLVERLGIRSYFGHPVYINEVIAGSLCVIDTHPREWPADIQDTLHRLADQVGKRLVELCGAFDETVAHGQHSVEIGSVLRVIDAEIAGTLSDEDAQLALALLEEPLLHLRTSLRTPRSRMELVRISGDEAWIERLARRLRWPELLPANSSAG